MKFNRIKYKNYRCFIDSELNFNVTDKRNIVLVVSPNGGGKTEIAFSFWWVLYGFDFKSLRGKTMTAYALNSDLHKELENSIPGSHKECSVQLEFTTDDNRVYTVKRTGIFTKKTNSVTSEEEVELFHINPDGTKSLPENNPDTILHILSRIIPQKILAGLIFDGERMQQLNDEDKKAAEAIEGVIKHVTNEALFELCSSYFGDIKKDNQHILKKTEKSLNRTETSSVESEIQQIEQLLANDKTRLIAVTENYDKAVEGIKDNKDKLSQHQESKKYENLRQEYESELQTKQNTLNAQIEIFYKDLDKGFLFITDKVIKDTQKNIEVYDVPSGLTTQAVKSIMSRKHCICGHEITDLEIQKLTELLKTLPPDNISSTILEMTRHIESAREDASTLISRTFEAISLLETEIATLKAKIADLSILITQEGPDVVKELEKQLEENIIKRDRAKIKITEFEKNISDYETKLIKLKEIRKNKTELDKTYKFYYKKEIFTEKCLSALKAIDEYNKILSLESINVLLNKAYEHLSSDYKLGRRLHIITYEAKQRYSMHSYTEAKIAELYNMKKAEVNTWRAQGLSEDAIKEQLIIKDSISGSTGQSKVNSLAFAKAILDYSSEERNEENIVEISREYPFLIDSPFTELDDDNQANIANHIKDYSKQIILLASQKSMSGIEHIIKPFVNKSYEIIKITSEHTEIKEQNNVNICF